MERGLLYCDRVSDSFREFTMSIGKVKYYNPEKGSGVIIDEETKKELTVDEEDVVLSDGELLKGGQKVEYTIDSHDNELKAIYVMPLEEE